MYSSTFTRPRIASKPDSSTIPLPRTPAAQTTVSDLINSVSSPFATIIPSSVASLIAVPMRNSTPFFSSCFTAYSTNAGSKPGSAVGAASTQIIRAFSRGTLYCLQSSGTRFASSPTYSIPVNPAPPTTIVTNSSRFSSAYLAKLASICSRISRVALMLAIENACSFNPVIPNVSDSKPRPITK
ncbi:Uncharacterised protein [Streptococcus pneumoniae]|nr:Uncharacterised protein [Streptococcus pneumoniae]